MWLGKRGREGGKKVGGHGKEGKSRVLSVELRGRDERATGGFSLFLLLLLSSIHQLLVSWCGSVSSEVDRYIYYSRQELGGRGEQCK